MSMIGISRTGRWKSPRYDDEDRWRIRQEEAAPIIETLHDWTLDQRDLVPNGLATAKALDYSLKCWVALTHYLGDGAVPIDIKHFGGHREYPGQASEGKICPGNIGVELVRNLRTKTQLLPPPAP